MKRFLIVDDQADIRKLIRMTLEFEDCEIHEASTGATAMRMAIELCPDFVLLTARGQVHDIEAGNEAGADEYLVKPFSPLELMSTIERLGALT